MIIITFLLTMHHIRFWSKSEQLECLHSENTSRVSNPHEVPSTHLTLPIHTNIQGIQSTRGIIHPPDTAHPHKHPGYPIYKRYHPPTWHWSSTQTPRVYNPHEVPSTHLTLPIHTNIQGIQSTRGTIHPPDTDHPHKHPGYLIHMRFHPPTWHCPSTQTSRVSNLQEVPSTHLTLPIHTNIQGIWSTWGTIHPPDTAHPHKHPGYPIYKRYHPPTWHWSSTQTSRVSDPHEVPSTHLTLPIHTNIQGIQSTRGTIHPPDTDHPHKHPGYLIHMRYHPPT